MFVCLSLSLSPFHTHPFSVCKKSYVGIKSIHYRRCYHCNALFIFIPALKGLPKVQSSIGRKKLDVLFRRMSSCNKTFISIYLLPMYRRQQLYWFLRNEPKP
jgi:hypothetical protein